MAGAEAFVRRTVESGVRVTRAVTAAERATGTPTPVTTTTTVMVVVVAGAETVVCRRVDGNTRGKG